MSKVCSVSGKKPATGNLRSHSLRATKRRFMPNVTKKTIIDPKTGRKIKVKISARAQKTLTKNPSKFKAELKKIVKRKRKRG
jgi:large subunit ribosomal protein L28